MKTLRDTLQGATQDGPLSLSGMHDNVLPPEISAWPLAPGWWVVLFALAISLCVLAWRLHQRRRAYAYQRAALAELAALRAAEEWPQLNVLLKRVALATQARRHVASLSGEAWTQYLNDNGGLPVSAGQALEQLALGAPLSDVPAADLARMAESWIRAQGPALELHP